MSRHRTVRHASRRQGEFVFRTWGGFREGAGRPPSGNVPGASHLARPTLRACDPVHVTLRVTRRIPSLRRQAALTVLKRTFAAGKARHGFRLVHYSVQSHHLHLIVEAGGGSELARGLQGLSVRIARGMNRELGRRGRFFSERYHARALRTPREVRNALAYVLLNWRHHTETSALAAIPIRPDPYSSGGRFDGWAQAPPESTVTREKGASTPWDGPDSDTVVPAKTWLLKVGWRRRGAIELSFVPGARTRRK